MKQAQDDVKNQTSEFLTYASEVWYFKYIHYDPLMMSQKEVPRKHMCAS